MSYHVSRYADGRDSREILSASGHDQAADIAYTTGLIECNEHGQLWVNYNGDIRAVTVEEGHDAHAELPMEGQPQEEGGLL